MRLYHFANIGIGNAGRTHLPDFRTEVIIITDDMAAGRYLSGVVFF